MWVAAGLGRVRHLHSQDALKLLHSRLGCDRDGVHQGDVVTRGVAAGIILRAEFPVRQQTLRPPFSHIFKHAPRGTTPEDHPAPA